MRDFKPWVAWGVVIAASFAVRGDWAVVTLSQIPPNPRQVVANADHMLMTTDRIQDGQHVRQSLRHAGPEHLTTSPVHTRTDLFGIDGLSGITLALMTLPPVRPVGLMPTSASVGHGMRHARSIRMFPDRPEPRLEPDTCMRSGGSAPVRCEADAAHSCRSRTKPQSLLPQVPEPYREETETHV